MSDVPQNTPTPISPEPTPSPTPEPAPAPEPAPEPVQSLITTPEIPAFDPETLTLPEGFDKGEHFTQFSEWAKEAGINQPQAEKLVGLYAAATKASVEATTRAWEEQNSTWQNEVKADKELGGTNLTSVLQTISKMLDNPDMSDPKFREALDFMGGGNNPAIIRTLYRWAKALGEGASIAGNVPARDGNGALANRPANLADAFYGPTGPRTGGPNLG